MTRTKIDIVGKVHEVGFTNKTAIDDLKAFKANHVKLRAGKGKFGNAAERDIAKKKTNELSDDPIR